jgi:hypothetical protein
LASVSSNPLASDEQLRSLTPTGKADRRGSVAGVLSSAQTALFLLRVFLVEAFLITTMAMEVTGGRVG